MNERIKELAEQALEALKVYGSHTSNCDHLIFLTSMPPQRKPCSCGLVASITALQEALAECPVQEPVYHLRQFGDVTKEELDRYIATGDINPQPAPVKPS